MVIVSNKRIEKKLKVNESHKNVSVKVLKKTSKTIGIVSSQLVITQ